MVNELYQQLLIEEDMLTVRQTLSKLRQEIKDEDKREELIDMIGEKDDILCGFLQSEDAKTRKNCALLLGDLAGQNHLEALVQAYEKEEKLFVKSAYLSAIGELDYRPYLDLLRKRQDELMEMEFEAEDKKHLSQELHILNELLLTMDGGSDHEFRGNHELSDLIVLGNREQLDVLEEQIKEIEGVDESKMRKMKAGIRVQTDAVGEIAKLRTYHDILFLVKGMITCDMDPLKSAKTIADSTLIKFMERRHKGKAPFYFRVEIKSKMPLDKKSAFAKKMASEIETLTNHQLINSTSHYEFEIRLIENVSGKFNVMVKLYSMKDDRFAYRKEVIAASMKPVNVALLVELAKEDMIKDAQILDPFCGVGTFLIERQMVVKGNTSYGIDIFGKAIEKAKTNTEAAGQIVHYINKDFFEFTHEYLFDEVFTEMPFAMGKIKQVEIEVLYEKFFAVIRRYLKEDATLILYTRDGDLLERLAKKYHFALKKQHLIDKKNDGKLYILKTFEEE